MLDDSEGCFPLIEGTDRFLIDQAGMAVRACLCRMDVTPSQIRNLAVLLFGIERLPLATPGLAADLTLSCRSGNDKTFVSISLRSDSLSLSSGGYVYTDGAGGDSFGDDVFYVENGGFREVKRTEVAGWLETFKSHAVDPKIDLEIDCEEMEFDWDAGPDETAWESAAKQHEEIEPEEDGTD